VFKETAVAVDTVLPSVFEVGLPTIDYAHTAAPGANRDPAVYDDPERFDIARIGAPAILTFGGGIHYCLGAILARLEIAEALRILAQRLSNPRRVGDAPWKSILGMSGPMRLAIEFDVA
jgi:cytochrome P450